MPITIEQFANLFEAGFTHSDRLESNVISQLLLQCRAESNVEVPEKGLLTGTLIDHSRIAIVKQE